MDVVRRAWEGGQLAQDLQCGYLRDRRLFEEGDGGYGRQRGWTSEHQRPKISAWDRTEPHTKTDKTLEQQSYSSLKDTGFCLVSGRTALPSRQGEWSTCVYTCTIKKKNKTRLILGDLISSGIHRNHGTAKKERWRGRRQEKRDRPTRSTLILREMVTFSV